MDTWIDIRRKAREFHGEALARANGCVLVDREMLAAWIRDLRSPGGGLRCPRPVSFRSPVGRP